MLHHFQQILRRRTSWPYNPAYGVTFFAYLCTIAEMSSR